MKRIKLTQGKYALVDDADFEWLNQWKWYAMNLHGFWYAATWIQKNVYMHRLILDAPKGKDVDHINHDTLNNQRQNIRVCTHQQNTQNHLCQGVFFDKNGQRRKRWLAHIGLNGKQIKLGRFKTKKEAFQVRKKAEQRFFKEFAYVNKIQRTKT